MQIRDIRQTAWFWMDKKIINIGLSVYELSVYCFLCSKANNDGKCWPAVKTISDKLKISERQVFRCLDVLKEKLLITIDSGHSNKSNVYTLITISNHDYQSYTDYQSGEHCLPVRGVLTTSHTNNTNITITNNNSDEVKTSSRKDKLLKPNKGVIEHFVAGYLKKTGNKYHFLPKDGKLIDDLISISGADEVVKRINNLFLSDEEFYKKAGYTVGVLYACFNKLCDKPKSSTLRV